VASHTPSKTARHGCPRTSHGYGRWLAFARPGGHHHQTYAESSGGRCIVDSNASIRCSDVNYSMEMRINSWMALCPFWRNLILHVPRTSKTKSVAPTGYISSQIQKPVRQFAMYCVRPRLQPKKRHSYDKPDSLPILHRGEIPSSNGTE
jgi:hypothetical protein